ncbi:MAG: NCS2 family permease [Sedimentisphaerales bacterium]|nr:NCS2 family permease [Sedimentisphaerales bacterium]
MFQINQRRTSVRIELTAGLTTFLTMSYIIFVNPSILANAGMPREAVMVATCLATGIITIATGLACNAPIAMAPGMGLNAFLAFSLVQAGRMSWQTGLGVVFLSGLLCLSLTLLGLRRRLVEAIPPSIVGAISVGIGLFITFIGLTDMGLVVRNEATIVGAGPITPTVLIALCTLILMAFLQTRAIRGALLVGIVFATALGLVFGYVARPTGLSISSLSIRPVAFKLDILGALKWSALGSVFSLMFMDMFDSIGTLVACCHMAQMVDQEGRIRGLDRLLAIDAGASMLGAILGTSTMTSYIESAAGIEEGGRTGLTAVVTGVCFLAAILLAPVAAIVPKFATGPALVMVGLFMLRGIARIDLEHVDEAFPAFVIMVMIALSYNISNGLAFGFISFTVVKVLSGKIRQVKPAMWLIAILSAVYLIAENLPSRS